MAELNVYQKLQQSRVDLQNKQLKKSGINKFSNFNYFELADFLPSINEIFLKNGLSSHFNLTEDKAILRIIEISTEKEILFSSPIKEVELKGCTAIQALGAVHTYMKRYLYLNALEIVEADILDENAGKNEPSNPKKEAKKQDQKKVNEYANYSQVQEYKKLVGDEVFKRTLSENNSKIPLDVYNKAKDNQNG